ncbi:class I SAM-dependent methyltransferase [Gammaproteobacteria bacterium]|nr:class I SAM-dependent methyltransferase [Gammaproteobacteria bacterium]
MVDDLASIDVEQRELWNAQTADYWVGQKSALDELLAPLTDLLIDAANLSGSERVGDIGCGTGATALRFASKMGLTGHVTGIDISKKLIGSAISAAQSAGVSNVTFIEADAARFVFDTPQDLMTSRCGVMFFGDLVGAFSNLRKGLRPGGQMLLAVWCAPEENEWYQFPMRCVEKLSGVRHDHDHDAPGAFTLARESRVRNVLTSAGFHYVDLTLHRPNLFVGRSAGEAADLFMAMNSIQKLLHSTADTSEERVRQHMLDGLKDYQQANGVYMNGTCWLISARVPK